MSVPEDAEQARAFVEGALRRASAQILGVDEAAAVVADLEPILQLASSHVRARSTGSTRPQVQPSGDAPAAPASAPEAPEAPEAPDPAPLVLIATHDRSGIQRLARRLVDQATVRPVRDVFELVYALESQRQRRAVVVLDCCLPVVEPDTVASMLTGLNAPPRVVLWGATAQDRDRMSASTPGAKEWVALGADADDREVAQLLTSLLE